MATRAKRQRKMEPLEEKNVLPSLALETGSYFPMQYTVHVLPSFRLTDLTLNRGSAIASIATAKNVLQYPDQFVRHVSHSITNSDSIPFDSTQRSICGFLRKTMKGNL
jgi:hypothetical protein